MSTTATRQFTARKGSRITDEQAQRYGPRIAALQDAEGVIDPASVVKDARCPSSPLHEAFEWDDGVAAEKYRLHQARRLLASIEVTIEGDPEANEPQTVRAFYHVETPEHARSYVALETVQTNTSYRHQIVEDALRRLRLWRDRFEQYTEFRPVTRAIAVVESQLDSGEGGGIEP
jgi:hypothetical protein